MPITVTPGQIASAILAIIGLVLTILNIIDKITNMKKNADAPMKEIQARLTALEVKAIDHEQRLLKGNDTFRKQDRINKMFERVNLAFIDFEIAYCHNTGYESTESLMKAKGILEELLTDED